MIRKPGERRLNRRDIGTGAISLAGRVFGSKRDAKARESRVSITFPDADVPVPVGHRLGFVPTGYVVVSKFRATGTPPVFAVPGDIYNDQPLQADKRTIVLKCTLAGTTAEIIVR